MVFNPLTAFILIIIDAWRAQLTRFAGRARTRRGCWLSNPSPTSSPKTNHFLA